MDREHAVAWRCAYERNTLAAGSCGEPDVPGEDDAGSWMLQTAALSWKERKSHAQWIRMYPDGWEWEVEITATSRPQPCERRRSGQHGGQSMVSIYLAQPRMPRASSHNDRSVAVRNGANCHVNRLKDVAVPVGVCPKYARMLELCGHSASFVVSGTGWPERQWMVSLDFCWLANRFHERGESIRVAAALEVPK